MDRDELIFKEYKTYCEQKENFVNRNFSTNKFYMVAIVILVFAMIYTGNIVFLNKISATLVFAIFGIKDISIAFSHWKMTNTKSPEINDIFDIYRIIADEICPSKSKKQLVTLKRDKKL